MPSAYHKQILVGLNEDSVRARKTRLKSASPMSTTTRLQVITNNTLEKMIPDKKYDDFHGSTRNDMLSLVVLPPLELMWNVTLKQKIALYHHNDGTRRITLAEVRFFVRPVQIVIKLFKVVVELVLFVLHHHAHNQLMTLSLDTPKLSIEPDLTARS